MNVELEPTELESFVYCPFTVGIDTREQRPYQFLGLRANTDKKHARLAIRTERVNLKTGFGDYTILELPKIAIERKSKEDLYSSIGQRRENFEERLVRMGGGPGSWYAAVVIEAEISELVAEPPAHTKLNPKSLMRTILAWQMRYPTVAWWFLPNRSAAEAWTFRLLERFWNVYEDRVEDLRAVEDGGRVVIGDPQALQEAMQEVIPPKAKAQANPTLFA